MNKPRYGHKLRYGRSGIKCCINPCIKKECEKRYIKTGYENKPRKVNKPG